MIARAYIARRCVYFLILLLWADSEKCPDPNCGKEYFGSSKKLALAHVAKHIRRVHNEKTVDFRRRHARRQQELVHAQRRSTVEDVVVRDDLFDDNAFGGGFDHAVEQRGKSFFFFFFFFWYLI